MDRRYDRCGLCGLALEGVILRESVLHRLIHRLDSGSKMMPKHLEGQWALTVGHSWAWRVLNLKESGGEREEKAKREVSFEEKRN